MAGHDSATIGAPRTKGPDGRGPQSLLRLLEDLRAEADRLAGPTAAKPVRIAVWGEPSSGKSTVINVLLRGNLVPDFFGHSFRPLVLVRHAAQPRLVLFFRDGRREELPVDTDGSFPEINDDPSLVGCLVLTSRPHVRDYELIELPFQAVGAGHEDDAGFGPDPNSELAGAMVVIGNADILVWTTIASQAWRLSEKNVIEHLGPETLENSIIAVSRSDKLRNSRDFQRVCDRIQRETEAYFRHIVFLHGARSLIADSAESAGNGADAAWEETSGQALHELLEEYATSVRARGNAKGAKSRPAEPAAARTIEPVRQPDPEAAAGAVVLNFNDLRAQRDTPAAAEARPAEPEPQAPAVEKTAKKPAKEPAKPADPPAADPPAAAPKAAVPATTAAAPTLVLAADPAALSATRTTAESYYGILSAGLIRPGAAASEVLLIHGQPDDVLSLAGFSLATLPDERRLLNLAALPPSEDTALASVTLLKDYQITCHEISDKGVMIFMVSENSKMNQGIARTAFTRLMQVALEELGG